MRRRRAVGSVRRKERSGASAVGIGEFEFVVDDSFSSVESGWASLKSIERSWAIIASLRLDSCRSARWSFRVSRSFWRWRVMDSRVGALGGLGPRESFFI